MTGVPVNARPGPQTHAIVIGVGYYEHLIGGRSPIANPMGLHQLTSPPASARAVTDWLLQEYRNSKAPLGSVEVLVSEPAHAAVYRAPDGQDYALESATLANIEQAVLRWYDRAHTNADNLAFFYFCGHGLARGVDNYFLPEDFGVQAADIMGHAIHVEGLHSGMERCQARRQCFFIDSCRSVVDEIVHMQGQLGRPIIRGAAHAGAFGNRSAPILYATSPDQQAYAQPGQPSRFTRAVLGSFRGAGADDVAGAWIVDSYGLPKGIEAILDRESRDLGIPEQRCQTGGQNSGFDIHELRGNPIVPVVIGCVPEAANAFAEMAIQNGVNLLRIPPAPEDWEVELEAKSAAYQLSATFPAKQYRNQEEVLFVRPPYRRKRLRVLP